MSNCRVSSKKRQNARLKTRPNQGLRLAFAFFDFRLRKALAYLLGSNCCEINFKMHSCKWFMQVPALNHMASICPPWAVERANRVQRLSVEEEFRVPSGTIQSVVDRDCIRSWLTRSVYAASPRRAPHEPKSTRTHIRAAA